MIFAPIVYAFVVVFFGKIDVFNQHIEWKHSSQRIEYIESKQRTVLKEKSQREFSK